MLRQEYTTAHSILMQTNRFPITIDKNCLSCMSDGKETNHALKGFKMACLSYAPSQVNYRQGTYQRVELLGIRRGLMEKVVEVMHGCELFENNSVLPRRYFDDLVLQQQIEKQVSEKKMGQVDTSKLSSRRQNSLMKSQQKNAPFLETGIQKINPTNKIIVDTTFNSPKSIQRMRNNGSIYSPKIGFKSGEFSKLGDPNISSPKKLFCTNPINLVTNGHVGTPMPPLLENTLQMLQEVASMPKLNDTLLNLELDTDSMSGVS